MAVEHLHEFAEVGDVAAEAVDFVSNDAVEPAGRDVLEQALESPTLKRRAGGAGVLVAVVDRELALVVLGGDEHQAGLALPLERVELTLEALFRGLAGVY